MSDIFREVDDDLRREQLKRMWDRYGTYVIGLAVLIVLVTAGWRFYEYWQEQRAEASGDRFVAALRLAEDGKHTEAVTALDELVTTNSTVVRSCESFKITTLSVAGLLGEAIKRIHGGESVSSLFEINGKAKS